MSLQYNKTQREKCKSNSGLNIIFLFRSLFCIIHIFVNVSVSRWIAVFLCFSLIALVFPISPVLVAAFSL